MFDCYFQGKRGVWIKLPIELSNLVQPTVEVLAVQEKSGKFRGSGVWKFPTGVVEPINTEFIEVLAFR
ncbi:hypothetical protein BHE74_00034027 [Ensete ventricosum]|nr:hypothetical protein GW17_00037482 [Ensete ventricosum]RWW59058.1 hypothetical protein BHE74_00034027 [Ensete ventricosum]